MTHEPADLEVIIDYHLASNVEAGHPPRNVNAWRNACRKDMLENERIYPDYIHRAAAGLRARAEGKRITHCREERGTHGMHYAWHPEGTDQPPTWWNPEAAKREYEQKRSAT